ncbi:MAG: hypothetical protein MR031_03735 [Tenericutes bacterium]|nr:hypothetical protein [Mycoplasmatota bacterium]
MRVKINEEYLQSREYRKLFEFIQREGVEPLLDFYCDMKQLEEANLIQMAVMDGTHPTLSLIKKYKPVVEFLKTVDRVNLPTFLHDPFFREFLADLDQSQVDTYLENARFLEDFKVSGIKIFPSSVEKLVFDSEVYYKKGQIAEVFKCYSDGDIDYSYVKNESMAGFPDVYRASVTFKKKQGILLLTHNYEGGSQLRSAYVSNFDFDPLDLPESSEISSYDVPYQLEKSPVFIKRKR